MHTQPHTPDLPSTEGLSRSQAYDYAKRLSSEPSAEITRKLFYALDLSGECSWRHIQSYLRENERPRDAAEDEDDED